MSEILKKFVGEHPQFFEKNGDCYVLRSDIHDLVEQYARLVDNDEYERVRGLVESIRQEAQEQLANDASRKKREINRLQSEVPQIVAELDQQEASIREIDEQIAEIQREVERRSITKIPWYYSSLVFWLLLASGIGIMYLGISVRVNGASSFLLFGAFLCVLGCVLQSSEPPLQQTQSARIVQLREKQGQLESKKQLAKVKRATLLQQKSVAKQRIQDLQTAMRNSFEKNRLMYG
jgi:septal ring factor EnvC (AmiA/AmiB activator)